MDSVIDLTGATRLWQEPELGVWRRAAVRALAEIDPSLGPPPAGDPMLRECLAELLAVDPATLVITAGVRSCAAQLMRGCRRIVVERPTFLGVVNTLRRGAAHVLTDSWERLAGHQRDGTGIWFTAPCRNPDGRKVDEHFLAEMNAIACGGTPVVCNTAYRWFAPAPALSPAVIQVGTLHKLAGRGARLGWVLAGLPEETSVWDLARMAPPLHWQRTWGHFLADGGAELLLARHRCLAAARAAFLGAVAESADSGQETEGPNVLIPVVMPEGQAVRMLADVGIRVSLGSAFQAWHPSIRVCLSRVQPDQARAAGERVAAVLRTGLPPCPCLAEQACVRWEGVGRIGKRWSG